ncbi:uncharacterized protein JCM6883_005655 [Sporobolomyces salmoneus]|uniref:uncharacterized protein n=1 Tax=Sporobolomyces salmoneus TaxID=183962 RepID=UPI003171B51B
MDHVDLSPLNRIEMEPDGWVFYDKYRDWCSLANVPILSAIKQVYDLERKTVPKFLTTYHCALCDVKGEPWRVLKHQVDVHRPSVKSKRPMCTNCCETWPFHNTGAYFYDDPRMKYLVIEPEDREVRETVRIGKHSPEVDECRKSIMVIEAQIQKKREAGNACDLMQLKGEIEKARQNLTSLLQGRDSSSASSLAKNLSNRQRAIYSRF